MGLVNGQIEIFLDSLKERIYTEFEQVSFCYTEDKEYRETDTIVYEEKDKKDFLSFHTCWTVPESFAKRVLAFSLEMNAEEEQVFPGFSLYVNGVLLHCMDRKHRDCVLTNSAEEGKVYHLQLCCPVKEEYTDFDLRGSFRVLEPRVEKLYYDLLRPFETMRLLRENSEEYRVTEEEIQRTMDLVDFKEVRKKSFYEDVEEGIAYIQDNFYRRYILYPTAIIPIRKGIKRVFWFA